VRQQVVVDLAEVLRLQIAKLSVKTRAAAQAVGGGESGIAVRRDVPVVGDRRLEAAAAVEADARWQEARFSLVVEGKAHRRRGKDGHAVEAKHRVLGDAFVDLVVDADARRPQDPHRLAVAVGARATRVGGVQGNGALIVDELDARRLAAGAGAREAIGRRPEEAFEALDLELQLGTREDVAVTADDDVAGRPGQIVGLVVGQAVGADDDRAAPELDVADRLGVEVGAAVDLAGAQDDRQLARRVAARRCLQGRRLAQLDARGGAGRGGGLGRRDGRGAGRSTGRNPGRGVRLGPDDVRGSGHPHGGGGLPPDARGPMPHRATCHEARRSNSDGLAKGLAHEAAAELKAEAPQGAKPASAGGAAGRGRCRPAGRARIDL
jgi:hypothetical protein